MPEVKTRIDINSDAQTVWNVLTDIPAHAEWNTIFRDFKGTAELGRGVKLKVMFAGKHRAFAGKILDCDENKVFAWGSPKSALDILINARHYFILEQTGDNKTQLTHGETFGGLLPLLAWPLIKGVKPLYEQFNRELKARAENQS